MRTRIKICGVTDPDTAAAAVAAGADAIGLVFHPPSARHVELAQAAAIAGAAGPFVATVAVLVNPDAATVRVIVKQVRPGYLQFHGEESDEFCAGFGVPYIKALRVKSGAGDGDLSAAAAEFPNARALLLDTHRDGVYGGSGETFDWRCAAHDGARRRPLILAGGLQADNVAAAIAQVRPFAVDVSSGVEVDGEAGRKDADKIRAFCRAVAAADATVTDAADSTVTDVARETVTVDNTVTAANTVDSTVAAPA